MNPIEFNFDEFEFPLEQLSEVKELCIKKMIALYKNDETIIDALKDDSIRQKILEITTMFVYKKEKINNIPWILNPSMKNFIVYS